MKEKRKKKLELRKGNNMSLRKKERKKERGLSRRKKKTIEKFSKKKEYNWEFI